MTKIATRINNAPKDTVTKSWVNRLAPDFAWPYLQLMRADRPIGTWLLLWPCLWSIALASHHATTIGLNFWHFYLPAPYFLLLFSCGAFVMRGAGCVVNDIADHKFDAMVDRTKGRPLPSGRVTITQAFIFLGFLSLTGLMILIEFNNFTIMLGFLSLGLVVLYPFMKRITYWPQFVLGLTFNWGALMGWSAVLGKLDMAPILLYMGGIFWTLGYDTIYAHQDKEDDALIGVKSTALRLGNHTPKWLYVFYTIMLTLFGLAGYLSQMGNIFYAGLIIVALHCLWQIKTLQMDNSENCLERFKSNRNLGLIIFISIIGGHYY
ncbi:MAG: 4-hydroxybenzoate octaprenyltransferase [Emcibacter sp.]|nr:4-hydroxybenzoate octaprenyltransferase [Emcibacter sp.]